MKLVHSNLKKPTNRPRDDDFGFQKVNTIPSKEKSIVSVSNINYSLDKRITTILPILNLD